MAFEHLGTLGDRPRCAVQKWALKTRLEEHTDKDALDVGRLETWKREVYTFAKYRCLCCGITVKRTLKLVANRAEAHHIERRSNKATRYDVRNGVCLCLECHGKVTRFELRIVGVTFFVVQARTYINGRGPLEFRKAA